MLPQSWRKLITTAHDDAPGVSCGAAQYVPGVVVLFCVGSTEMSVT